MPIFAQPSQPFPSADQARNRTAQQATTGIQKTETVPGTSILLSPDTPAPSSTVFLLTGRGYWGGDIGLTPNAHPPKCVPILDTAGRLHVDEEMMNEIAAVSKAVTPHQIYLVCDAMTGQDAVNSAKEFNERLELDGVILTKLDGDARGGAALSVKAVTGKPIKFIGMGEKLDNLEPFHPDRMASRILGMGDVVTLVEKAQEQFDEVQAQKMQTKMAKGTFGFDDFLKQMQSVKKMGGMSSMMKLLPGMGGAMKDMDVDDGEISKIEGIVHSMTTAERTDPDTIDSSRRRRIARGAGRDVQDVAGLIKTFKRSREMMKMMAGGGGMGALKGMLGGGGDMMSAMAGGGMRKVKQRSKRKRQPRKKR